MLFALIAVSIVVLISLLFAFNRKKQQIVPVDDFDDDDDMEELPTNRREHFRLKFNNSFCNFQPLISSGKQLGAIRDISAGGIRIETSTNDLTRGSLLMLYFDINGETFIFEGIVKRKIEITPNLIQYGIKFMNSTVAQQDKLYRKLRALERKNTNAQ